MTRPMGALATTETETEPELRGLPPGFRELYAEHYDFLWRCALRLGAPPADVEDVIQETFVIALRRYDPEALAGRARASTWLFAILHNVLRNHARSERRRRARLDKIALISDEQAREQADTSLGVRLLDEFLTELDADHRSVFVLSELEGMRGPEIARALGLNANTARSRLRTARQAFRARFEHEAEPLVSEAGEVRAPVAARARTLALLAVPSKALGWASAAGSLLGVKAWLVGGVALGLGIVAMAWPPAHDGTRKDVVEHAALEPTREREDASVPLEPASVPSEVAGEAIVVTPVEPKRRAPADRRAAPDGLGEALESLASAREALASGDATACLAELDATTWPSALEPRKVALELGALCMLGRTADAEARARAFRDANPERASAIDVEAPCATNTRPTGGQQGP